MQDLRRDTIVVYIECGLGARTRQILRLKSINAPALIEVAGVKARDVLESMLLTVDHLIIKTNSRDKYGRYVADVLLGQKGQSSEDVLLNGLFVNQELLDRGVVERAK